MDTELEWALAHSWNHGSYPDVFTENTGMDFSIPGRPEYFVEKCPNRKIKIEITSFRFICGGAMHYYASIKADGVHICRKDEAGRTVWCMGFLGEEHKKMTREQKDAASFIWNIDVEREVTREEIEKDPERWRGYHVGSLTNAFLSREEAIETAKRIIKARFQGDWKIEIEGLA